jgi:hypothetical protein
MSHNDATTGTERYSEILLRIPTIRVSGENLSFDKLFFASWIVYNSKIVLTTTELPEIGKFFDSE